MTFVGPHFCNVYIILFSEINIKNNGTTVFENIIQDIMLFKNVLKILNNF